jgi:hypothetical protein
MRNLLIDSGILVTLFALAQTNNSIRNEQKKEPEQNIFNYLGWKISVFKRQNGFYFIVERGSKASSPAQNTFSTILAAKLAAENYIDKINK